MNNVRRRRAGRRGHGAGRRLAMIAGLVVGVGAGVLTAARIRYERQLDRQVDDVFAARTDAESKPIAETDIAGLPEPVQRWLRGSGVVGSKRPSAVRLRQTGSFRLGEGRPWMPFDAAEYYTTDPPGFVWVVRMQMMPLLSIIGSDRYFLGKGSIQMRLLGVVPVAAQAGGVLNQGAMLRYLNETMWFPAACLSPYISWEAVDPTSARATMAYSGVTASATFIFDDQGRLTNMTALRYNSSTNRLEPWSTPIPEYGEFNGIRVPVAGEGMWNYESGDFAYIRLRLTRLEYDRPERY